MKNIITVTLLIISIIFFILDKNIAGSAILICFISTFVLSLIPSEIISEFKFSFKEFAFKTRELNDSLNELKELTKTNAEILLDYTQRSFYEIKPTLQVQNEVFQKVEKTLNNVGISSSEINQIQEKNWHYWVKKAYTVGIMDCIRPIRNDFIKDRNKWTTEGENPLSIDEINGYFEKHAFLEKNEYIESLIEQYNYYLNNNKHRSEEEWEEFLKLRFSYWEKEERKGN